MNTVLQSVGVKRIPRLGKTRLLPARTLGLLGKPLIYVKPLQWGTTGLCDVCGNVKAGTGHSPEATGDFSKEVTFELGLEGRIGVKEEEEKEVF